VPVHAGLESASRLEMKMCSISVAPMPSSIGFPVLAIHAS
jgi:hypothetical protein